MFEDVGSCLVSNIDRFHIAAARVGTWEGKVFGVFNVQRPSYLPEQSARKRRTRDSRPMGGHMGRALSCTPADSPQALADKRSEGAGEKL